MPTSFGLCESTSFIMWIRCSTAWISGILLNSSSLCIVIWNFFSISRGIAAGGSASNGNKEASSAASSSLKALRKTPSDFNTVATAWISFRLTEVARTFKKCLKSRKDERGRYRSKCLAPFSFPQPSSPPASRPGCPPWASLNPCRYEL